MRLPFTIRDLLWLTLVVALAVGWWVDRRPPRFQVFDSRPGNISGKMRVLIDNETGETWVQYAAHGSWGSTSQPPDQEATGAQFEHGSFGGGRGRK